MSISMVLNSNVRRKVSLASLPLGTPVRGCCIANSDVIGVVATTGSGDYGVLTDYKFTAYSSTECCWDVYIKEEKALYKDIRSRDGTVFYFNNDYFLVGKDCVLILPLFCPTNLRKLKLNSEVVIVGTLDIKVDYTDNP